MPVLTLTTDWGHKDHYIAAVKGSILSQIPDAVIVDISHEVPPFNTETASFVIRNCYRNFPKDSIHIIGVNTLADIESPHLVIKYEDQYFIGADNGIFSLIFDENPEEIYEIEVMQDSDYFTFSTRDVFVKVAGMIAQGVDLKEFGKKIDKINQKLAFHPVVEQNTIKGIVIHIDNYENAISNIHEKLFRDILKGKPFSISFRGYEIKKISKSYDDVPVGEILAIFGSGGFLEIAMNQGNAASLLGLHFKDTIRIEYSNT